MADRTKPPYALRPELLELNPLEEMQIAWRTMQAYRNVALKTNDYGRAALYLAVIQDAERMIETLGGTLPPELNFL